MVVTDTTPFPVFSLSSLSPVLIEIDDPEQNIISVWRLMFHNYFDDSITFVRSVLILAVHVTLLPYFVTEVCRSSIID